MIYGLATIKKFLWLVIFFFNKSKTNADLEPRTGHFRGLVVFEAKAKYFEMRPRGQERRENFIFAVTCNMALIWVQQQVEKRSTIVFIF